MSVTKHFTEAPVEQSVIDNWKEKYSGVFAIEVPATDEPDKDAEGNELPLEYLTGYFRRLSIDEIGMAQRASISGVGEKMQIDNFKSSMIMYNTSLIGGHPAFESDDEVKRSALAQFQSVIKARTATIKKL